MGVSFFFRTSSTSHQTRGRTSYRPPWKKQAQWGELLLTHWKISLSSISGIWKFRPFFCWLFSPADQWNSTDSTTPCPLSRQPIKDVNRQVIARNAAPERLWVHSREPIRQPLLKKLGGHPEFTHKACLAFTDILWILEDAIIKQKFHQFFLHGKPLTKKLGKASGSKKWKTKLHSLQWPAGGNKSNCAELYECMILLYTWLMTPANTFLMSLWSLSLDLSLIL